MKERIRLLHVRIIFSNVSQLLSQIFSSRSLYGLKQTNPKMILSVKNMINVLLKTMSLMRYQAVMFYALNMRNELSLTKMTTSQRLTRSPVSQAVLSRIRQNTINVRISPRLYHLSRWERIAIQSSGHRDYEVEIRRAITE